MFTVKHRREWRSKIQLVEDTGNDGEARDGDKREDTWRKIRGG
jgi:hypothetical protein